MINKNSFVKIMNSLRDYNDGVSALEKSLGVMFEDNWVVGIFDGVLDALFEDVEGDTCPKGMDPLVYEFAFFGDWGRKERCLVEINGEKRCPRNAEELYDLLLELRGDDVDA